MVAIYVVSVEEAVGKTAICAGLGKLLQDNGKKVGYLRPQAAEKGESDGDMDFMKQVLGLSDAVNAPDVVQGRDAVLIEAMIGPGAGDALSQTTYGAAKEMNARVIAVEAYTGKAMKYVESYKGFGDSLLGVVLNKVPQSQLKRAQDEVSEQLGAAGVNFLGAITEDRVLLSLTVGELAESIGGRILNSAGKSEELVENYMLGAMVVDSGLDYFGRKSNKAAIVRQDRPDMQLAALETSTRCLVLSGGMNQPVYNVLQKAENRAIPIISTEAASSDIVTRIEEALKGSMFNQEKKLPKLAGIMKKNLDLQAVL